MLTQDRQIALNILKTILILVALAVIIAVVANTVA